MKKGWIAVVSGSIIAALALIPAGVYGVWNEGVWGLFLFGLVVALMPALRSLLPHIFPKIGLVLWRIMLCILCVGTACVIVFLIILQTYPVSPSPEGTVVILGCQVRDGRPSQMMRGRLDTAIVYLRENPDTNCVVSGGQGPDEAMSEAECMKQWLVNKGIDESRIFKEDKSTDTDENLRFSADVIRDNALGTDIVIVTDAFHAYRSALCAERYGLDACVYPAHAPWFLQQSYWFREILALMKFWFLE